MKHLILIIFIVLFLAPVNVKSEYFSTFSRKDIILQGIFVSLACMDWKQTRDFRSRGGIEQNSILGEEPTQERLDILIFTGILTHTLITYGLPSEHRWMWIAPFIFIEFFAVRGNARIHNRTKNKNKSNIDTRITFGFKF